ncbi:hypothetical protein NQ317_016637 [Molorchus minor]|uniref:Tyr recombinase domain-containing protein n=1 Tax=Molorchus minor TaxID=1323400 RepID=A0ABQ9J9K6_9CUCU|nr:hypothetical protein NQ317_016637 [Molorchus minor]
MQNLSLGKFQIPSSVGNNRNTKFDEFHVKRSKTIIFVPREQNNQFLKETPDEEFLMAKVAIIIGIAGALRSDKLVKLPIDDVQDLRSTILVSSIYDSPPKKTVRLILLPFVKNIWFFAERENRTKTFFVANRNNKRFCITSRGLPKQITEYLKLPDSSSYTGHCFRRLSTSLLADAGADISIIKRHGGWKSSSVTESYVKNSLNNKKTIAKKILVGKDSENENQL